MLATWMIFLVAGWLMGAWAARLLPGWGLGPVEELRRMTLLLCLVFGGTVAMLFWGKAAAGTSRFVLTTAFFLSLPLVPLTRTLLKRALIKFGVWGVPTVLYTDTESCENIIAAMLHEQGLGYILAGVYSDTILPEQTLKGLPVMGNLKASTSKASVAILALSHLSQEQMNTMIDSTLSGYRRIVYIPDLADSPSLWVHPRDFVGILGLEISSNLLDPLARFVKRLMDITLVVLFAPFWVPLCLLTALLIWLGDRGHPLFLQERIGQNGRLFRTWKFRTMHIRAEQILEEHLTRDASLRAEWKTQFKLKRDPRITRIGRLLRRTSLDELPQLINVLMGDMSLVGPRPLPTYHFNELPERVRNLRHRVHPGITGLWQVSGRSEAGHAAMPKWDTYYVRNWSVWLDIVILVRTLRTVASGRGAF